MICSQDSSNEHPAVKPIVAANPPKKQDRIPQDQVRTLPPTCPTDTYPSDTSLHSPVKIIASKLERNLRPKKTIPPAFFFHKCLIPQHLRTIFNQTHNADSPENMKQAKRLLAQSHQSGIMEKLNTNWNSSGRLQDHSFLQFSCFLNYTIGAIMPKQLKTSADGRKCVFPNCNRPLSAYNHESYCHVHLDQLAKDRMRTQPYRHHN